MGSILLDQADPTKFMPQLYPPFPTDTYPVAYLDTFSLARLQSGDSNEQARLFETCKTRGFFYLDFTDTSVQSLPADAEVICRLSEEVFHLPMEEKVKYKLASKKLNSILGYKVAGWTKTDGKGTPDTAEFMNVGKDDILDNPTRIPTPLPPSVLEPENRRLLARYQTACHHTGLAIMSILATQLGLPADIFEDKHRLNEPSDDHVRMTKGPPRKDAGMPEIQTPGHTDFGTITILFNWLGGLQVWSEPSRGNFHQMFDGAQPMDADAPSAEWLWVKPKPRHAIVNLGDAAVKFTGGVLCSGRHRVVPAPGEQGLFARYSIVYFVRPEDKCVLKRLKGGNVPAIKEGEEEQELTAQQWIMQQSLQLRDGVANGTVEP